MKRLQTGTREDKFDFWQAEKIINADKLDYVPNIARKKLSLRGKYNGGKLQSPTLHTIYNDKNDSTAYQTIIIET